MMVAREGPNAEAVGHDSVGNARSEREARHDASVQAIRERVDGFLRSEKLHDASRLILDSVLKPTQSAFGFVGLLLEGGLLRLLIHDGFSWHPTTNRAFYEEKMRAYAEDGYLDFHESDNLIAAVVKEKSVVLTNSPGADPRSKGVPAGHPPLRCFLGVPALKEQNVVGMIGLANRPNGYAASDQAMVEPLIPSVVSLYEAYCRLQRDGRLKMSRTTG